MHAHHQRLVFFPFALDQCEVLESVAHLAERYQFEVSVFGGHVGFLSHFHQRVFLQPVGNEVFDGDELHVVLLGKLGQLRQAGEVVILFASKPAVVSQQKAAHIQFLVQ